MTTLSNTQRCVQIMTKQKWYVNVDKTVLNMGLESSTIDGYFNFIYKWCVVRQFYNSSSNDRVYFQSNRELNPYIIEKLIEEGKLIKEKTEGIRYIDDY